ncbi:MAG: DUF5928 domain-containing protein [Octadecabacter sp.]|nr:DUF5928 domain-containing protein [Octadecabacter sp.]
MAKIAFILLCHKDPEAIVHQAEQLTAVGDYIAIHFDANAPKQVFNIIFDALNDNPNVTFAQRRIKCGWGEWSLVQATLNAISAAIDAFPLATHFYMVSGDCMAIKSARHAKALLDSDDCDYIESFDFFKSDWIKTGMKEERLIYHHFFNERKNKALFNYSLWLQQKLGFKRKIPVDLQVMIGSQWWCLRRRTVQCILEMTKLRPDVMSFFRTTWIPDETFFQTLVYHHVPETEIRNRTLTFLMFTVYGLPVTFYNDHYNLLLSQQFLFARKISSEAIELKGKLELVYASDRDDFKTSTEGQKLFRFLTGCGRVGRRFGPRFWETEASLGRERELLIIACKKRPVAKRFAGLIGHHLNIPSINYLFDEEDTDLPDLGGIQSTVNKRMRHRRALMRMLFDYYDTNKMIICLDTANIDLMKDFFSDQSTTRLLEMECDFYDEYLIEYAKKIGLVGEFTPDETMQQLLPTIRYDVFYESDLIRDADFRYHLRVREIASPDENAQQIAEFLSVPEDVARGIAQTPYLFAD